MFKKFKIILKFCSKIIISYLNARKDDKIIQKKWLVSLIFFILSWIFFLRWARYSSSFDLELRVLENGSKSSSIEPRLELDPNPTHYVIIVASTACLQFSTLSSDFHPFHLFSRLILKFSRNPRKKCWIEYFERRCWLKVEMHTRISNKGHATN